MKNVEQLNLVALDAAELQEVQGGGFWAFVGAVAAAWAIEKLLDAVDWEAVGSAIMEPVPCPK